MTPAKGQSRKDREQRHEQMRRRILKAAMKLFLRRGFSSVSIRNIANEIGYSPGALYRYFKDKDEIFFALRAEGFDLFHQMQLQARTSAAPRKRLQQHAAAYIDFALNNREYYEIMFMIPAPMERITSNEKWLRSARTLDLLRDDVQLALDAGVIKKQPVEVVTFGIWSIMHGALSLIFRGRLAHLTISSERELTTQLIEFQIKNFTQGKD